MFIEHEQGRTPAKRQIRKVLITGGRAPSALELARLLARAGYEVYAAESMPYYLCRSSKAVKRSYTVPAPAKIREGFISALERIIADQGIDMLIPTCEETFYVASACERLSRLCTVFTVSLPRLRRLHSKWEFISRLEEMALLAPRTVRIGSPEEWEELRSSSRRWDELHRQLGGSVVWKPEYSRFAAKVHITGDSGGNQGAAPDLDAGSFPWVAQQFIAGRQLCTYSVVHEGRLCAHSAYASQYSVKGGASVYFESLEHEASLEWVKSFAHKEAFTGQLAFDFIETEDGKLYPIECNPRTTSGLHLLADEAGIAAAFAEPEALQSRLVRPRAQAPKMLSLPMLAYGLSGQAAWRTVPRWLKDWAAATDVVFSSADMRPFLEQLPMLAHMRQSASAGGVSLIEASTADLEWNGETI